MKYDYSFCVWPDEKLVPSRFKPALFEWFRMIQTRTEETYTEEQFDHFRQKMLESGFILHEISRVPHVEPEVVL
jgi:hypothetical protein